MTNGIRTVLSIGFNFNKLMIKLKDKAVWLILETKNRLAFY